MATTITGTSGHLGLGISPSDIDSIGRSLNIASSTGGAIYLQDTDAPTTKFAAISYSGGTAALQIHAHHSASYIDFGTNGTERLRIDSSGRLLLGTTTVGSTTADDLTVATSGDTGITVRSGTSNSGNLFFADGTSGNSNFRGYVQYLHSSNALLFGTNAGERLRITSNGHLLLGTSTDYADANSDDLQIYGTGDTGMSITSGTSHYGSIYFGDSTSANSDRNRGIVRYGHTDDVMQFWTAATERLRINSGGKILLGSTRTYYGNEYYDDITINNSGGSNNTGGCGITMISSSNSWGAVQFGDNDDDDRGYIKYDHNADKFIVATAGSEKLRIDSSGRVGIGTNAPTNLVHLSGGSSPTLKINASDATPGIFMVDADRTSQDQHLGEFRALWNGNLAGRIVVVAGPDTTNKDDGHMDFYTSNGGSNGHRMRIKHDGNIGIGTTAPPDKLNVIGAVRINQSAALDHLCNAGTMLEVRGDAIGSGGVDYDFFKGFKIALNDGAEWGGQAQFAVGRWQESGTNARSSLMISLGHGAQSSVSNADSDIMLLTSDGQVRIEDGDLKIGTSGHGIDFSTTSAAPGSTSELFNDYEEGSFTVTDISGGSLTFTSQANRYTKVGRVVHIMVNITFPTTSNANAMKFGGVPFAIEGGTTSSGVVSLAGGYGNGVQIHMDSAGMHATYDGSLAIGGFSNNQFSGKQVCFALTYST